MKFIKVMAVVLVMALESCSAVDVARIFRNVNLEKKGITVRLRQVPRGMYADPLVIKFDKMLTDISDGEVRIKAFNVYTVGDYEKLPGPSVPGVTNFMDPHSKFKDAWFGIYVILDDEIMMGRRFILKNPHGRPDDLANMNDRSLLMLPRLDQKIILWSSHQDQKNYSYADFEKQFYFEPRKGTVPVTDTITDRQGRSWYRITGEFDTAAALTDVSVTDMKLFSSIRNYVGLPDKNVYDLVAPWHPVVIKGRVLARYFRCSEAAFWAVVYYNGASFTTKKGVTIDTWNGTDLRSLFEKMFDDLVVGCPTR